MNKSRLINILLIILVISITTIILFFIKIKVNNKGSNNGNILYENKLDNFLNIINLILVATIFIQIIMSFRGKQYGGIVATLTLSIINLKRRPSKLLITECGIGVSDQFNGILQFITWDNLKKCAWNKFDRTLLIIDSDIEDACKFSQFIIKDCDVRKVNSILVRYCNVTVELI